MAKDKSTVQRSSATITGIPSAGAIGGGDNSDRLGRPRRYPFYRGSMGSPSMSADSGQSTAMSRVNKGWEEDIETTMFPEQEDIDLDSYSVEDVPLPRTRKVPKYFRTSRRARGTASISESESQMKKYSLVDILEDADNSGNSILEQQGVGGAASGFWNTVKSIGTDVAADWSAAAVGSVPVFGDAAAVMFVLKNIGEMSDGMEKSKSDIMTFLSNPTKEARDALDNDLDDLITDLIDFIQRSLEALPDPGVSEIGSAGISIVQALSRLRFSAIGLDFYRRAKVAKGALSGFSRTPGAMAVPGAAQMAQRGGSVQKWTGMGGSGLGAAAKVATVTTYATKWLVEIFDSEFVPEEVRQYKDSVVAVPSRMVLLADLIDDYDYQRSAWYDAGESTRNFDRNLRYQARVNVDPQGMDQYSQNRRDFLVEPLPSLDEWRASQSRSRRVQAESKKIKRFKNMSKKTLEQFIVEALSLEDLEADNPYLSSLGHSAPYDPFLMGHRYVGEDEAFEIKSDYIDQFLVQTKADEGTITSDHRVDENVLREFIREVRSELKKK
jgi:hypothetical protein